MLRLKTSCLDCKNSNCIIKQYCSKEILKEVDSKKIINRYAKQQIIFHENNESDNIYFVHKGIIKVLKTGAFNKNQIIRFSQNGDILGHRGFISSSKYPVSAQTITDSEICYLPKDYFFELLNIVPKLTIQLMLFFSDELHQEETKLRDMAIFNVREKVAKAILLLVQTFKLNKENIINSIDLLTRQDIAETVGLNSNQVTKVLSEFKQDGIIETKGKNIRIIKPSALESITSF